eukprot:5722688-Pleurochrysis_carterae.AAC.1
MTNTLAQFDFHLIAAHSASEASKPKRQGDVPIIDDERAAGFPLAHRANECELLYAFHIQAYILALQSYFDSSLLIASIDD